MTGRLHNLEVQMNLVVIEDTVIPRPPYMGVGEWLDLWEGFCIVNEGLAPARTAGVIVAGWKGKNRG